MAGSAALAPQPARATNIVVQPGTTAGYLYFPSTEGEVRRRLESIKNKVDSIRSDVTGIRSDLSSLTGTVNALDSWARSNLSQPASGTTNPTIVNHSSNTPSSTIVSSSTINNTHNTTVQATQTNAAPTSCTLNGTTIAHVDTIRRYIDARAPTCTSEPRTCSNGTLIGNTAAIHSSCEEHVKYAKRHIETFYQTSLHRNSNPIGLAIYLNDACALGYTQESIIDNFSETSPVRTAIINMNYALCNVTTTFLDNRLSAINEAILNSPEAWAIRR